MTHTHRTKRHYDTRTALDHARQGHLRAFHAAVVGGTPADELTHDLSAFCRAALQLFRISPRPEADARAAWRGVP